MWNTSDLESMKDTSQRPIKKSSFLFLRYGPPVEITTTHRRNYGEIETSGCDSVVLWVFCWLQKPWIHGDQRSVSCPKKRIQSTWFGRSEDASRAGYIYKSIKIKWLFMHLSYLGAWQAHYDLKDPKGLAGFLIDSDIKLVRAESGSSEESNRHKSEGDMKRNGMHKMKRRQSFQLA